jgi:hypothetical protein
MPPDPRDPSDPLPFDPDAPRPFDDAPDELLEQARRRVRTKRDDEEYDEMGRRLTRRILIAFALIVLLAAVFFILLPAIGLYLPPVVPMACFAAIVVGAVLAHKGDAPPKHPNPDGPIDIDATVRDRSLPPGSS